MAPERILNRTTKAGVNLFLTMDDVNCGILRVLIVDDSPEDAELLLLELRRGRWSVIHEIVDTPKAMAAALNAHRWDVVIADYSMPSFSGLAALAMVRGDWADIPFILVSGFVGEETAVEAMRAGANDYLFKGNLKRLVSAVERELRDAEGRRKAEYTERLLQKGKRQLADAQRLARLGIWHADLRTDVTVWSEEACRILGSAAGENGPGFQRFLEYLHEEDRALVHAGIGSVEQILIAQDCHIVCPNPNVQFVHIRGEIIRDLDGRAIEATGMIQDITERHLLDIQLQETKEAAEAASLSKSRFLANMSHEIRTPLSAILGFAGMLSSKSPEECAQIGCVRIIQRNARHLLEIINEVLDISKIEGGQVKVEPVPCDLPELLAEVIALMRPRAAEKGLGFEVTFPGPIPHMVETDPLRLRQILINLLGNALKFTEFGKIIMRIVDQGAGSPLIDLRIEIVDTGIGMTPEQLGRLFVPFAQGDESITRKFGGTGLGLTICRQFAKLLGGNVNVVSQPGVGSTFTLTVNGGPSEGVKQLTSLTESELLVKVDPKQQPSIRLQGKILLVDDGDDNQRLLRMHLTHAGAVVTSATNGQMAVQLATAQDFDLIFMDMQMPIMDGYAATLELRRRGLGKPIVALTAHAMAEDRAKCLSCGCTGYLSKPVDEEKLLRTAAEYLSSGAAAESRVEDASAKAAVIASPIQCSYRDDPRMMAIVPGFVAGLAGKVLQMERLLEDPGDIRPLQVLAHQLAGTCSGYGFAPILPFARKVDQAISAGLGREGITEDVLALIEMIRRIEGFGGSN